jgi:hypothetical protein
MSNKSIYATEAHEQITDDLSAKPQASIFQSSHLMEEKLSPTISAIVIRVESRESEKQH